MSFSEQDYQAAADKLGAPVAAIQAVADVEASGVTFWDIGGEQKPPIRLESHWFGKLTGYVFNGSHPAISSKKWDPTLAAKTRAGATTDAATGLAFRGV
jgi:hypothetical protein